jgi:hypothetical protein
MLLLLWLAGALLARDRNIHITVGFCSQTSSDRGYQCRFAQTDSDALNHCWFETKNDSDRSSKAVAAAVGAQNFFKKQSHYHGLRPYFKNNKKIVPPRIRTKGVG